VPVGEFAGHCVVVTGGAQGIGAAISRAVVAVGGAVVIGDRDGDSADKLAAELNAMGTGQALAVVCNVTDEQSVGGLADAAVRFVGKIDGWVNNAGITRDATLRKMSLADFRAVLDVHLVGGWLGTRAAAAVMRERHSGSIVNLSSISGKVGNIGQTNYSAAKAGIVGLTKAAAKELGHLNVRVNAVQPGVISTAMTAGMRPDILAQRIAEIPLGRLGEPDEIAEAVLFLLSRRSSYMTGNVIELAGGRHM
jgi:3-oxoacyl-[acyl-carrier protein] reductase